MVDEHGNLHFLMTPRKLLDEATEDLDEATAAVDLLAEDAEPGEFAGHVGEATDAADRARQRIDEAVARVAAEYSGGLEDHFIAARTANGLAWRIGRIAGRMGLSPDEALDWMEWLAEQTPLVTATETDAHEDKILREVGITGIDPAPPRERASLQSLAKYALMVENSLSIADAATEVQLTEDQVKADIANSKLYAIRVRGDVRIPDFQFADGCIVSGLDLVLPLVPKEWHPLQVLGFLTTESPRLIADSEEVAPLEWLKAGNDPAEVVEMAARLESYRG